MSGGRRLLRIACGWLLAFAACTGAGPAEASWLSRTPAADREQAAPLRSLDLQAVLGGETAPAGIGAALGELPDRCVADDAFDREDCDDVLRCAWLAARGKLALRWGSADGAARAAAARDLERAARRLAVGGQCGGEKDGSRWERDRRQAALDATVVAVALWADAVRGAPAGAAEWPPSPDVRRALAGVLEGGLDRLEPARLRSARPEILAAWERSRWLAAHPAIARVRALSVAAWKPAGGVPRGCGDGLWDGRLLEDGWRGVLVRKSVPQALTCLKQRLPDALRRRGLRPADAQLSAQLVDQLVRQAALDSGGREFPGSAGVLAKLGRLREAVRAVDPSVRTARSKSKKATPAATPKPRPTRRKSPPAEPVRREPVRKSVAPAEKPSPRRSRPASPDAELISLARRIDALGLEEDGRSLVRQARRARDEQQRRSTLQGLIVAAHRGLCGPLERADASDLSAVRDALRRVGSAPQEEACRGVDGRTSLGRLLDQADGLRRLAAAAAIREAARALASDRVSDAERRLGAVPEALRGTTWRLVRAWAHRRAGDPVAASEVLAALDESVLDRLRASGDESVARLVAHATVARVP
jgi:hypothetical protein